MKKTLKFLFPTLIILFALYTGAWFGGAYIAKEQLKTINKKGDLKFNPAPNKISGFPFWPVIEYTGEISTPDYKISVQNLNIKLSGNVNGAQIDLLAPKGFELTDKYTHAPQTFDKSHISLITPYPLPKNHTHSEMENWRQNEGEILIESMLLQKQDIKITGEGMLRLDNNLQPNGKINLEIFGYQSLLKNLTELGIVPQKESRIAGTVLELLASSNKTPHSSFKTPLIIKGRTLYLGPMKIGRINKINWPKKL